MKILLIIPSITNYFTFLDELTIACLKDGNEVALAASPMHFQGVACYEQRPKCEYFPIEFPQGMNLFAHLRAARLLQKVVESWCPDVIHVHIGAAIFTVSLARTRHWPKVIATHHGLLGPLMSGWKGRLAAAAEALTFCRVNEAWLLNQSDLEWMQSRNRRVDHVRVYSSRGIGCLTDRFDPGLRMAAETRQLRLQLGIEENARVFIFIGRHVWFKGFDLVVRAFMRFHRKFPHARLLILGEPYAVHASGLTESETEEFENCPAVIRVGWVNNVQSYLALAQVNLFPSEREGMPVNVMESICMGVPVITRNTRGCKDLVEAGKSGFLMQHRDVNELEAYMQRCMEFPAELDAMSQYCIQVREQFDRNLWIREQMQIYRRLVPGS